MARLGNKGQGRRVEVKKLGWLLVLSLAMTGCGGDSAEEEVGEAAVVGKQSDFLNELIELRVRSRRSDDRFSASDSAGETIVAHEALDAPPGVAEEMATLDPGGDWQSEHLSAAAATQLKTLLKGAVATVVEAEISSSALRPSDLQREDLAGGYLVFRPAGDDWKKARTKVIEALTRQVLALSALFEGQNVDPKVKVVGIALGKGEFEATMLVELRGTDAQFASPLQISTTWSTRWSLDEIPRLRSLDLLQYEEVRRNQGVGFGFTDVTHHVLGETPYYRSQILTGIDFWASRITRLGDFSMTGHHGLAVGDVNGDDLEDLYLCDGGSLPNRLYLQQEDGTLRDVSREAGVDWLEDSRCALLVDLDNDGDLDLVVATIAMIAFAENDGKGRFAVRGGHPGARYPFSLSAADYDNDGDLDLYACVYSAGDGASGRGFEATSPLPFNEAENGGRNILLTNLGDFQFADGTKVAGLDKDNTRWSFAAAWEDYDRDGDPDLYVANDFGRNCFYRNDGGTFSQVAAELGVEDMASGMSVAWGDFNRDGAADLYVGNMFSSAGRRVSTQEDFTAAGSGAQISGLRRMARGNTLFAGSEEGLFRDVSEETRTYPGRWAWSSGFVDINNDGWEDLAVANGYLTGRKPDDL